MTQTVLKKSKPRRAIAVWSAEEFLARTSWYRFGPHSPKRQAHEIIKQLLAEIEALKCAATAVAEVPPTPWIEKIRR